jgi:BirA family biotin operon repressor/biotin-[acetyl-CoA-carboxylase] ligase
MTTVPAYDLAKLRTEIRPFKLLWSPRLRSTNDRAITLRKRNQLFAPALVLTACQTAGRGRGKNAWFSTPGVITATWAFAADPATPVQFVPLAAGLAVRSAAAQLAGTDKIELKWPNDVVCEGRKLAGLLCERVDDVDLIGVGFNLNIQSWEAPAGLKSRITSILRITEKMTDPTEAILLITRCLQKTLDRRNHHPLGSLLAEYRKYDGLQGKKVVLQLPNNEEARGICRGIDDHGRLKVEENGSIRAITTAHVMEIADPD